MDTYKTILLLTFKFYTVVENDRLGLFGSELERLLSCAVKTTTVP